MKKFLLSAIASLAILPVCAQLNGAGYYRGENAVTNRYIYVVDDKGDINTSTTNADVLAIDLWKGFTKASSDPSTVLYISPNGSQYDIAAQGTSVHQFMKDYVSIAKNGTGANGTPTYMVYAKKSGAVKYLGDAEASTVPDHGEMSTNVTGERRKWYIIPMDASKDGQYFGVKPTVTAGGKYYSAMFTGFPYSVYSQGLKFWKVSKVDGDIAVIEEVTGTIPAGTGIVIECSNPLDTDNRLNVGGSASALSSNMLSGVYFDNSMPKHYNRTKYDPKTMRMLSADANGNLTYITASDLEFLPRNESYLKVPAGTPSTLRVMTVAQYEEEKAKYPASVTLSNPTLTLNEGETGVLTATILPATATQTVTWTSSDTKVATVNANGSITAKAKGTATVTATTVNGLTATCTVTVRPVAAAITLSQSEATVEVGSSLTLTATVTPDDAVDKSVAWTSSNMTVATVKDGVVTTLKPGVTSIVATTANGRRATCSLTVTPVAPRNVTLTPATMTLTEGDKGTLTATVTPADAAGYTLTWTSSDPAVATVANGMVTAVAPGEATLTVTTSNGLSASAKVSVQKRIYEVTVVTLNTSTVALVEDDTFQLIATVLPANATDRSLTWTSSDPAVASVDGSGKVTAVSQGTAVVTATAGNGIKAECSVYVTAKEVPVVYPTSITLSETEVTINKFDPITLTATVGPEDATDKSVTWSIGDANILRTEDMNSSDSSASKKFGSFAGGTTTVTATTINGLTATCTVHVLSHATDVTIEEESVELRRGEEYQLNYAVTPIDANTGLDFVWSSSDEAVATVNGEGKVTAAGPGTCTVSVGNGEKTYSSVEVYVYVPVESLVIDPTAISAIVGDEVTLQASWIPTDANDVTLTWIIDDTEVATVEKSDMTSCTIKIQNEGTARLVATAENAGGAVNAFCNIVGESGIEAIIGDAGVADVYNMNGVLLLRNADADDISRLAPGLYIIAGRKTYIP